MTLWMGLAFVFVGATVLAWGLIPNLLGLSHRKLIRQRMLSAMALETPMHATILGRLAEMLAPLNRWMPTSVYSLHIQKRLEAAGKQLPPMHFLVLQEIGTLTGLLLYFAAMGSQHFNVGAAIIFMVGGSLVPYVWLSNRIQSRRMCVSRDLPEIVDLLSLCVDAGLDFMNSLARVVKEFRLGPVTEELGTVLQEVRVGKRRRDALRAFSQRVQTPAASSFSRTLVQADRMGTGIAEALQVLSEDMRIQRYHWAERFAQQAPLKMLIPLLFSLGAALIIVAGPILGQFMTGGFTAPQFSVMQGRPETPKVPLRPPVLPPRVR